MIESREPSNTTDGSRWIVQVQPTTSQPVYFGIPPTAVGGCVQVRPANACSAALSVLFLRACILNLSLLSPGLGSFITTYAFALAVAGTSSPNGRIFFSRL